MIHALLTAMPLMTCALMTVLLLLEQRRRTDHLLRWLIAWAVAATLLYGGHFVYFHRYLPLVPLTDTVYTAMNLAVYPLYLIYISELTDRRPFSARPMAVPLLLLPAVVAGMACGLLYGAMDDAERTAFVGQYLYGNDLHALDGLPLVQAWLHRGCHVLFAAQIVWVVVMGIGKVRHYNRVVDQFYADTDDKRAWGLGGILSLLLVTVALSFVVNAIGRARFLSPAWLLLPSVAFSTLLFAIGYAGIQQRFSARDILRQMQREEPPVVRANTVQLCARLEQLMHDEQLFLQHDLRLEEVAKRIGTNRTYLLQALNEGLHMTFREYVNRQRIAYAERLMEANPSLSKTDVVALSGYNTASSFYRNYNAYRRTGRQQEGQP